jgi:hypothetical protein
VTERAFDISTGANRLTGMLATPVAVLSAIATMHVAGIESMLDWILKTTTSRSELWTNPALGLSETEAPPDKRGKWA